MIRAVLVVGWGGVLLAVAAFATGYQVVSAELTTRHLVVALFAAAALLLADCCVLIYLPLTARLVRRTATEHGLEPSWTMAQAVLARRGVLYASLSALLLTSTLGAGFPTFSGAWPPLAHHLLAWAAAAAQVAFLLRGGSALVAGERHLVAFAAAVEAVRYTPPRAVASPAVTPSP